MKAAIHQPNFMPYLGFFDKCDYSDIFVIYDSTQFKKNDFQNRNKIKGREGWFWLTVPVTYNFGDKISEVRIDNSKKWKEKHLKSIRACYSRSKFFNRYFPDIEIVYRKNWIFLSEFNIALIKFFLNKLGINCKILLSSQLNIDRFGTNALVEICKKVGCNEYLSGIDGKQYLDLTRFDIENINVKIQNYKHPKYHQNFGDFESHLSILDLLFNVGPNSLKIIRSGRYYESQC